MFFKGLSGIEEKIIKLSRYATKSVQKISKGVKDIPNSIFDDHKPPQMPQQPALKAA